MVHNLKRAIFFKRISSKVHILGNRAGRNRLKLLMHHGKSFVKGVVGVCNLRFHAVDEDLAFIHFVDTEQAFHQCRLTGAVFPHQCMNGAGAHTQIYAIQCLNAREGLFYPLHFESVLLCHPKTPFSCIPPKNLGGLCNLESTVQPWEDTLNLHKTDAARFLSAARGQEDARLNCFIYKTGCVSGTHPVSISYSLKLL